MYKHRFGTFASHNQSDLETSVNDFLDTFKRNGWEFVDIKFTAIIDRYNECFMTAYVIYKIEYKDK